MPAGAGEMMMDSAHKPPYEETRESLEKRAQLTAHAIVALNVQVSRLYIHFCASLSTRLARWRDCVRFDFTHKHTHTLTHSLMTGGTAAWVTTSG